MTKESISNQVKSITISLHDILGHNIKLYYMGLFNKEILNKCVAVVGSRRNTEYGKRVMKKLIPTLVEKNKIVVSGLMYGTDQEAHRETLECGGKTIAVLGWGINWKGAGEKEKELYGKIVSNGGAVISEWVDQASTLWTFPYRDRIMAAISTDIYVIEAAAKSGSLITAEWGRKFGKRVWAVPGPVTSKVSEGTNWLIDTGRARMWLPGQQLEINNPGKGKNLKDIELYDMLQSEALSIDEIALKTGRNIGELGAQLSVMMLEGGITQKEGKYYVD